MMRRAEIAQASVWLALDALLASRDEARPPDPRLAREQDYLTGASPRSAPAPHQQPDFARAVRSRVELILAPDQRSKRRHVERLESALRRTLAQNPPGAYRRGE